MSVKILVSRSSEISHTSLLYTMEAHVTRPGRENLQHGSEVILEIRQLCSKNIARESALSYYFALLMEKPSTSSSSVEREARSSKSEAGILGSRQAERYCLSSLVSVHQLCKDTVITISARVLV